MSARSLMMMAAGACLTGAALANPTSADSLLDAHRLLVVSAPSAGDARLKAQQVAFTAWQAGAEERDVSLIQIAGNDVQGASDSARTLRTRYGLPVGDFTATLVGKDGHVALRSAKPLSGDELERTIDAMPMRRAGQR